MFQNLVILLLFSLPMGIFAQFESTKVHSHNDYAQKDPFTFAYNLGAKFIEVDVHLVKGELMVAHDRREIKKNRTIETLYLKKMNKLRTDEKPSKADPLYLMVDIKTAAKPTLKALIKKLDDYPRLKKANFRIVISGNRPPAEQWEKYPNYIFFDGRKPADAEIAPKKTLIISRSFRNFSAWNGTDSFKEAERQKVQDFIDSVHEVGKPVRLWAIPDMPSGWKKLREMGVDVINTDKPGECLAALKWTE